MAVISREELQQLITTDAHPCVSIYMPTIRAGAEVQQNPIRLRNLLDRAEGLLVEHGMRAPEARQVLEPARELLPDRLFWQHQQDGLALFAAPGFFQGYRLPSGVEDLAVVSDRFHLKPLIPALTDDGRFLLLTLSQKQVHLYEATRFTLEEIRLEGVPTSMAEAIRFDEPQRQLRWHMGSRGTRQGIFHGHGVGSDEETKDRLRRFFQALDEGVMDALGDRRDPMVLAGVDYLLPMYASYSRYPNILKQGIEGSPDDIICQELHKRAWEIAKPAMAAARQADAELFRIYSGREGDWASTDVATVVRAARFGRVQALFVAKEEQRWGMFQDGGEVLLHDEHRPGDADLLDLAAVYTLLHDGAVHVTDLADVPGGSGVAAVFRYPLEGGPAQA